jgi:hypothetical protein
MNIRYMFIVQLPAAFWIVVVVSGRDRRVGTSASGKGSGAEIDLEETNVPGWPCFRLIAMTAAHG